MTALSFLALHYPEVCWFGHDLWAPGTLTIIHAHGMQAPLEPYSAPKSVLHFLLCPQQQSTAAEALLTDISCTYSACGLGSHAAMPGSATYTFPVTGYSLVAARAVQHAQQPTGQAEQSGVSSGLQVLREGQPSAAAAEGAWWQLPEADRRALESMRDCVVQLQQRLLHDPPTLRCYPVVLRHCCTSHDVFTRRFVDTVLPLLLVL